MKTKLLFTLLALYGIANSQGTWTQKANFPGAARWGASSFSINGKVYVAGGYNGSVNYSDTWEFDPIGNSWSQRANFTNPRRTASAFSIGGKGYLCCGINATSLLSDLQEYDPGSNNWTAKSSVPDVGRYGAAGFSIGSKGYVCGGNEGTSSGPFSDELWEYDPQSNAWNAKTNFVGSARYGITNARFVIGTKAYVGLGGAQSGFFNDMYAYDQSTNSWSQIANYPGLGRSYPAGFATCGAGFLGTGHSGPANSDFWQYSPTNNSWTQVAAFGGGIRWLMASSEANNKGYVGTGYDHTNYYNDWWEYTCQNFGVEEYAFYNSISVFPNPVTTQATFSFDKEVKDALLKIYDLDGREARTMVVSGKEIIFERALLESGVYIYRLVAEGQNMATGKMVIAD